MGGGGGLSCIRRDKNGSSDAVKGWKYPHLCFEGALMHFAASELGPSASRYRLQTGELPEILRGNPEVSRTITQSGSNASLKTLSLMLEAVENKPRRRGFVFNLSHHFRPPVFVQGACGQTRSNGKRPSAGYQETKQQAGRRRRRWSQSKVEETSQKVCKL